MGSNCTGKILQYKDFDQTNCDVAITPLSVTKVQNSFNPKFLSQLQQQYCQLKINDCDLQYDHSAIQITGASTQEKEKEKNIKIPKGILKTLKSQSSAAPQKHSVKFYHQTSQSLNQQTLTVTRIENKLTRKLEFHSLRENQNVIQFKFTDSYLTLQKQITSQELK